MKHLLTGIIWRFLLSVTSGQINSILSMFGFLFRKGFRTRSS
jgi:ABC-type sugar transport system permease subunit